jgi:hypothetical protein
LNRATWSIWKTAGAATAPTTCTTCFFNGVGYNAWENVWGIWNQFTDRDGERSSRIATMFRAWRGAAGQPDWRPYAPALQQNVFASAFPSMRVTPVDDREPQRI